ncbi:uncharacterized protein LOC126549465 [Aphis gossypii]|uniref:uncharacterized protein LOC126549465 n=1 Tax=Aphis gossypii TaxID=80765 RepID=UPI0021591A64|nr:uncharacterized protein LOC126549465 [Aphis gossypii]
MTNLEHFRRLCHAHLNNYPVNTFTNCTRMANVIAWNCNPKDPTSYYWNDKVITNDLTNGRRIIDHTSTTACRVDVSMPNTESASTAITTVSQNVEYNLNTDYTSSEICSEKTIKCTSAPRRYNVKSRQYPSITSPEHNGNNSVTTIHSTTK